MATVKDLPNWVLQALGTDPALSKLAQTIHYSLVFATPLSLSQGDLMQDGVEPPA